MTSLLRMVTALKSQTRRAKLFETILLTLLGVLMYVSQVIMSQLPNIEIVSLLIIVVTCIFGVKALFSVYIFVICEILTYGIGIWSVNYLYVWAVLCVTVLFTRKFASREFNAILGGIFGLTFDIFCSIPYFLTTGIAGGISYIISGFWFNILHCVGNLVLIYLLYTPVRSLLERTIKKHSRH